MLIIVWEGGGKKLIGAWSCILLEYLIAITPNSSLEGALTKPLNGFPALL